ncbi:MULTISPECIES: hypothetical protein [Burkholderia]|uniref:hypothetical protein n=1 Tax=Burkholderia TaxID=32008 RepID=UPI001CF53342|nr:hypothetical protein [Burkholderia cepacia]MCA8059849.1 hypothetical protein [Burkholderia cepacia]MCA8137131.1 hypothetical protein [Burkholderia cepacia]MCA8164535.1 hypothetical protein [Burkholderia cepacia]MDN7638337.1 hypothetical protein [Burkholderia cepacia]
MVDLADGIRAVRDSSMECGRPFPTFTPDRKVPRPAIRLALIAVLIVPLFAGCTSTRSGRTPAASATSTTPAAARKPVPADLMPGEQIDYAGHRCGNPNLYVKTHVCLFPQRSGTR